jgi:MoaA/NifB/PqqE/SkfB family radical SAM enzyme
MFRWVKKQFDTMKSPDLDWIQVEVTTCCNSACSYCPHTTMGTRLPNRHMPLDLFNTLIPYTKYTELIHLQGWGEPLLHPDIYEMIRICKYNSKYVGLTTNGTLLNEETICRIIDSRVDIMGVSLAGATAATHNTFRRGSDFDTILSNLQRVSRIKKEKNSRTPALHIAYLMLKSNIHEVETLVPLAKSVGAEQIVASNLSLIVQPELCGEALFNNTDCTDWYYELLEKTKEYAARHDIVFAYSRPDLDDAPGFCSENVCVSCIVNVSGDVSPCVFTNPVLNTDYLFKDQVLPLHVISFGNIGHENLSQIWHKNEYVRWRNLLNPAAIKTTGHVLSEIPESCIHCYKRLLG